MAILITGPTSVGKSSYLATLERDGQPVPFVCGKDLGSSGMPSDGYVHYNLLHRYESIHSPATESGYAITLPQSLGQIPLLDYILSSEKISEAVVLVASVEDLVTRAASRTIVEEDGTGALYNAEYWVNLLQNADLFRLYELLFDHLDERGIPYTVVLSASENGRHAFTVTDRVFVHKHLRGEPCQLPSLESVRAVADSPFVEYQTIRLPHGVKTKSGYRHLDNRDSFLSLLPDNLSGRSVLDIGCANGGLLVAAERLGASCNVGVELNAKRYKGAVLIGKLLSSRNAYFHGDFMSLPLEEPFDYVFCLNVIHHIEQYFVFLRKAAALAKRAFIIEYPNLADARFKVCHTIPPQLIALLERQPLIGVSSSKADQSYTFTEKAMDSILFDKIGGFRGKENRPSSIENRILSIYYK